VNLVTFAKKPVAVSTRYCWFYLTDSLYLKHWFF